MRTSTWRLAHAIYGTYLCLHTSPCIAVRLGLRPVLRVPCAPSRSLRRLLLVLAAQAVLLEKRINFLRTPQVVIYLALLRPPHSRELDLLAAQLRAVHRLTQHLHRELTRLFQIAVLVVVLLQQALCGGVVRAD